MGSIHTVPSTDFEIFVVSNQQDCFVENYVNQKILNTLN